MKIVLAVIAVLIGLSLAIANGAWAISTAIKCFKAERYFLFGVELFIAIWMVLILIKWVLM